VKALTRRPLATAALCAALLPALLLPTAGCRTNYDRPGPGVVTGRYTTVVKVTYWHLRISTDAGERRNYLSTRAEYETCQVGERWPDCGEKTS